MAVLRCEWCSEDPLYQAYHDEEWGVPVHDDRHLFELLTLEGAEAGLSWIVVLRKRENYRVAFDQFDPQIVATYDEAKVQALMQNSGIVRSDKKIRSTIKNAQAFLKVQAEFGTFDSYIWGFVGGQTLVNHFQSIQDIPAETVQSQLMSKDLVKRGFSFVGSKICYAFMQATGMVNDHTARCFKYPK